MSRFKKGDEAYSTDHLKVGVVKGVLRGKYYKIKFDDWDNLVETHESRMKPVEKKEAKTDGD